MRGNYHDVILPMVALRRLDTLFEPTKDAVLAVVRYQKQEDPGATELDDGQGVARRHREVRVPLNQPEAPNTVWSMEFASRTFGSLPIAWPMAASSGS